MYASLLGFLLVFQSAALEVPSPCDQLFATALQHEPASVTDKAGWRRFLARIQEAHTCYGEDAPRRLYPDKVNALFKSGYYQAALQLIDRFFEQFDADADHAQFAKMHQWRGYIQYAQGDLVASTQSYSQALEYAQDWSMARRGGLQLDIGVIFQRFHNFRAAHYYYDEARRTLAEADSSQYAQYERVRLLQFEGDLILQETAVRGYDSTAYRRAIALSENGFDLATRHGFTALASFLLIVQAEALSLIGNRTLAFERLDQAQRLAPQADDPTLLPFLYQKLGRLYIQTADFSKAEEALQQSFRYALEIAYIDHQRVALWRLGYLYEVQGDLARAEEQYRQAIEVMATYRASLRMTDWSAQAFGQWQHAHRSLVRVLMAQGRTEEAFLTLEQTRAQHLQDVYAHSQMLSGFSVDDRVIYDSLSQALTETRNLLAFASDTSGLRAQELRLIAERRALFDVEGSFFSPSLDTLHQVLGARNQVVLSYFIDTQLYEDTVLERPPHSYVFVLTADTLVALPLATHARALEDTLAAVSPLLLGHQTVAGFSDRVFSTEALVDLYRLLYAPAEPFIAPDARLVILPDGPLFMLPFGMLMTSSSAAYQYTPSTFLIAHHPIVVELATALLLSSPSPTASSHDLVAFGRTRFPDTSPASSPSSMSLVDLPAVNEELASIERRFRQGVVRKNATATEAAFFQLAPQARVLHMASHTLVGSSPLHNAIVLSTDDSTSYDGLLHLHELQQHPLSAQLVVLSGCRTARGVLHAGEGMEGLHYAFRALGVPSSVATSWLVDDAAMTALIDAFYAALQRGVPKDVALQHAQLAYLNGAPPQKRSPFFWAAPVLYGDPRSLPLEQPASPRVWIAGGLALLLLLFLLRLMYTRRYYTR